MKEMFWYMIGSDSVTDGAACFDIISLTPVLIKPKENEYTLRTFTDALLFVVMKPEMTSCLPLN
jgi:hypothetical protein